MYAKFFGLLQEPFSIAPDPRYLFMSERHREALAHLLYGVKGGGGFVLLTGEIGAGKTTVCRCFLEQIPKRCNVAYIFNPKLTVPELLQSVCNEFHIPLDHLPAGTATVKDYLDPLNDFLLRTHAVGQINVLIIDEAQALSADVLEQLRLLTNLETNERKLLQIILIGQPELRRLLARPELEQVSQRVIARYHLKALSEEETDQYIRHRLGVAGSTRPVPFEREALKRIHRVSRGIPRRINLLCDRALLGAYSAGQERVGREVIDQAAREVFEKLAPTPTAKPRRRAERSNWLAMGAAGGVLLGVALFAGVSALVGRGDAPGPAASEPPAVAGAASAAADAASGASAAAAASAAASAAATPAVVSGWPASLLDESQAWRELAGVWQLGIGDEEPCAAALRQQVLCYRSAGARRDLALLRRLERPMILMVQDVEGRAGQVLLTGLNEERALLRVGPTTHAVPVAALQARWRGEFATLWRAPPGFAPDASDIGASGEAARWVAARLDGIEGAAADPAEALPERVRAFQRAQGLAADGLAGPITLMQLNRVSGVDEPRLMTGG
jgi:general secretion pathway protein A